MSLLLHAVVLADPGLRFELAWSLLELRQS